MVNLSELRAFDWWTSGLILVPLFFLISRLNNACSHLVINSSRLINRSGLRTILKISPQNVFCLELFSINISHVVLILFKLIYLVFNKSIYCWPDFKNWIQASRKKQFDIFVKKYIYIKYIISSKIITFFSFNKNILDIF